MYVNSQQFTKSQDSGIELKSYTRINTDEGSPAGIRNEALETSDEDCCEDTLSSGDLMAFAWQVAEGMVR